MSKKEASFSQPIVDTLNYAFDEAIQKLNSLHELCPFLLILNQEGISISDHDYVDDLQLRYSVATVLKEQAPDGYIVVYDGTIDDGDDVLEAVVCEYATPQDETAHIYALPYTFRQNEFMFSDGFGEAGTTKNLFNFNKNV